MPASSKETSCFATLAEAFLGSHWNIYYVYTKFKIPTRLCRSTKCGSTILISSISDSPDFHSSRNCILLDSTNSPLKSILGSNRIWSLVDGQLKLEGQAWLLNLPPFTANATRSSENLENAARALSFSARIQFSCRPTVMEFLSLSAEYGTQTHCHS